jgi:hypothetical protein
MKVAKQDGRRPLLAALRRCEDGRKILPTLGAVPLSIHISNSTRTASMLRNTS